MLSVVRTILILCFRIYIYCLFGYFILIITINNLIDIMVKFESIDLEIISMLFSSLKYIFSIIIHYYRFITVYYVHT